MDKKTMNFFGVSFSLLSAAALFFPLFKEAGELVVTRGFNLVEFSPFGGIVVLLPFVLIALMTSKLSDGTKTLVLLGLVLFGNVACFCSFEAVYDWFYERDLLYYKNYFCPLFYSIYLLLAAICFFIGCNYSPSEKKFRFKDLLPEQELCVEPVSPDTEEFFLCNTNYGLAKYKENGEAAVGRAHLNITTSEGYFAALNDSDPNKYDDREILDNGEGVGYIMGNMSTGMYGMFYGDVDFSAESIKIRRFEDITDGTTELWMSTRDGFIKGKAEISVNGISDIRIRTKDMSVRGAAVIQDGELVAVASEYDRDNGVYKCISAELIAKDLCRKIYEYRVFQTMK